MFLISKKLELNVFLKYISVTKFQIIFQYIKLNLS